MSVRRAIFLSLGIVVGAHPLAAAEPPKPPSPQALALIGDEPITDAEVEALVGPQLAELRQKIFQLRSQGLDELIAQRLAEREAKRRGLTVEGLVKVEVDDKVVVTDADLRTVYEANKSRFGTQSEAEAFKQIEPAVRQQKRRDRQMTFVHEMRSAAAVTVLLEPLRAELHVPEGAPVRGSEKAPVTIVEFSDFQCPYCVRAQPTLKRVREAYGEKVRFVFVDFPLDIHPQAKKAHEAAACAHEQGKFWPMYDRLFTSEGKFQIADLKGYAGDTGLDPAAFASCLDSGRHEGVTDRGIEEGARNGVSGTPAFFINGRMIVGAQPFEAFAQVIDDELGRIAGPGARSGSAAKP
jgi:protein-disulfide isomerase